MKIKIQKKIRNFFFTFLRIIVYFMEENYIKTKKLN